MMRLAAAVSFSAAFAFLSADGSVDGGIRRMRALDAADDVCEITYCAPQKCGAKNILDVRFRLRPNKVSVIRCQLGFPMPGEWNGKLWGYGRGGWAGADYSVAYLAADGDAVASTDMGTGESTGWTCKHPPKPWPDETWDDFGWRATHLMTVYAKKFVEAFYGKPHRRAYFIGASTGGRQGLVEVQRFPADYDGVISELPVVGSVSLSASVFHRSRIESKIALHGRRAQILSDAAVEFMSERDEPYARGRFLTDPRMCDGHEDEIFDIAAGKDAYFADPVVRALLKELFNGPVYRGRRAHGGYGWGTLFAPYSGGFVFANFIEKRDGGKYDPSKLDWSDFDEYAAKRGDCLSATDSDLNDFAARGGKLMMTVGLEDQTIPFSTAFEYYERVIEKCGGVEKTRAFFRMFPMPGCAHGNIGREMRSCSIPQLKRQLEDWVEKGVAPDLVHAEVKKGERKLPVAAYPEKAVPQPDGSVAIVPFPRGGVRKTDPFYFR